MIITLIIVNLILIVFLILSIYIKFSGGVGASIGIIIFFNLIFILSMNFDTHKKINIPIPQSEISIVKTKNSIIVTYKDKDYYYNGIAEYNMIDSLTEFKLVKHYNYFKKYLKSKDEIIPIFKKRKR